MKYFPLILLITIMFSCSEGSNDTTISTINLSVDKEVGIIGQDTFTMMAQALDDVFSPIEGLEYDYYVDDVLLPSNQFIPMEEGEFVLTARYDGIRSKLKKVKALSLTENIDEFELKYNGNLFLTTHEWSVTGPFSYVVRKEGLLYEFESDEIPMYINGNLISTGGPYHFDEAGVYMVHAELDGKVSNEIKLQVRDQVDYPLVEIPIIFHSYNVPSNLLFFDQLIDTLNASFNDVDHTREQVIAGTVNPNAVDMRVRFKLAETAPQGFFINGTGHQILDIEGNPETLDYNAFKRIQDQNTWDEEKYINIWLTDAIDFDPPEGYVLITGMTSRPVLKSEVVKGLMTSSEDTLGVTHSIILYPSQLKIHGDYIVRMMGTYFGLFGSISFGCLDEGDYCADTPKFDFSKPDGPNNTEAECSGYFLTPNNHMSFNRMYTNFTYDQRERVRAVLRDGWNRPGE